MHTSRPMSHISASSRSGRQYQSKGLWRLFEPARVNLGLAATAHLWTMISLARLVEPTSPQGLAFADMGLGWSLLLGLLVATGLTGWASTLDDIRNLITNPKPAQAPPNPIKVFAMGMVSLAIVLVAGVSLGKLSGLITLAITVGLMFYQFAGLFFPSTHVLGAALLHAMLMLIANPRLSFAWPVLLTSTHVVITSALHYHLSQRRPRMTSVDGCAICGGWAFLSLLLASLISINAADADYPQHAVLVTRWIWAGPALASIAFIALSMSLVSAKSLQTHRTQVCQRLARLSVLWLVVYDAAWLLSAGAYAVGSIVLSLFAVGLLANYIYDRLHLLMGGWQAEYVLDPGGK